MVENQIGILTFDPSFGHNLCFKYSNGSWEPISDIYVSKNFQWYNEFFNLMNFDLRNTSLKIWKSIETLTPKVRAHLEVCKFIPSHSPTLPKVWNVTPRLPSWPAPLQALALVMNRRLGSQHYERIKWFTTRIVTGFLVAMTTYNLTYFMPWVLFDKLHELQQMQFTICVIIYLCNSCNSTKTTFMQLQCNYSYSVMLTLHFIHPWWWTLFISIVTLLQSQMQGEHIIKWNYIAIHW
jgi:hypothetical protein